jgi:hypothetical protein
MTQIIGTLAAYLGQHFIVALVWLAGAILSLSYRKRYPKVSGRTLIGLAILFAESVISTYVNLYVPLMLRDQGWSDAQLTISFFPIAGVVESLIQAVGWGFIFAAIFGKRDNT